VQGGTEKYRTIETKGGSVAYQLEKPERHQAAKIRLCGARTKGISRMELF